MLIINGSGRSPTYWLGWHYPTDTSNPQYWYDEINILTYNDEQYGYTTTINEYIRLYDFDFNMPADADIDGIQVEAKYRSTVDVAMDVEISLWYNNRQASAPDKPTITATTSWETHLFGHWEYLWGKNNWRGYDFANANFSIEIQFVYRTMPFGDLQVDHVRVNVYGYDLIAEFNSISLMFVFSAVCIIIAVVIIKRKYRDN